MTMADIGFDQGRPSWIRHPVDSALRLLGHAIARLVHSIAACPTCWMVSTLLFGLAGVDLSGFDLSPLTEACAVLALVPVALQLFDDASPRRRSRTGIQQKRPLRREPFLVLPYAKLAPFLTQTIFDRWRR